MQERASALLTTQDKRVDRNGRPGRARPAFPAIGDGRAATRLLSTAAVEPRERFPFWRDAVCATFVALDCERPEGAAAFSGEIATSALGVLQVSEVASDPHRAERSRRHISRASDDDILLSYQIEGRCRLAQDGRTADLLPGCFSLYDSARPYRLAFPGRSRQLVLKMPRPALRAHCEDVPEASVARAVAADQDGGDLAGAVFRSLLRTRGVLEEPDRSRVAAVLLEAVGMAVAATAPAGAPVRASTGASLRRVKHAVEALLARHDLTAGMVGARSGMGVRALGRLFAAEGTSPMRYVWARRLELCHRDLQEPRLSARTVTEIAFSWGFNDPAHFSRAYKSRYRVSPRQSRIAARQARVSDPVSRGALDPCQRRSKTGPPVV